MTELLRRLIPESIRIETSLEDAVGACCIDPVQLQQVVLNLALNARNAMPARGTLRIELARATDRRQLRSLGLDGSRDHARLTVSDTWLTCCPSHSRLRTWSRLLGNGPAPALERAGRNEGVSTPLEIDELDAALREGELLLHYQLKIDLHSGKVAGFEALARWRHQRGMIAPDVFIPFAERTGRINQLTERVIDEGLDWLARATAAAPELSLAINLSALSLGDAALPDTLRQACAARGLEPGRVVLELTETSAMTDPSEGIGTLARLRIMGSIWQSTTLAPAIPRWCSSRGCRSRRSRSTEPSSVRSWPRRSRARSWNRPSCSAERSD